MTDNVYHKPGREFAKDERVQHGLDEYVRGKAHTNTVEGFFSLLKRGIVGSFHHVGKGHLHRYCDEIAFRYNTRMGLGCNDAQRAALIVKGAEGKRLTCEQPAETRQDSARHLQDRPSLARKSVPVKRPKYIRPKPKSWERQLRLPIGD